MPLFERRKMRKAKEKDLGLKDPSHEYKIIKAGRTTKKIKMEKKGWEYVEGIKGKDLKNVSATKRRTWFQPKTEGPKNIIGEKKDWVMKKKLPGRGSGSYQNTRTLGGMTYR